MYAYGIYVYMHGCLHAICIIHIQYNYIGTVDCVTIALCISVVLMSMGQPLRQKLWRKGSHLRYCECFEKEGMEISMIVLLSSLV